MLTIVVITQKYNIFSYRSISSVFDCSDTMKFFTKSTLYDLVLISCVITFLEIEVKLIVSIILYIFVVSLHVQRDRKNAR